ncbi:hypothetical protein P8452_38821 [Trifolium repens]|nr:hypothetical protein P8452_38821 [Trifolium repens]
MAVAGGWGNDGESAERTKERVLHEKEEGRIKMLCSPELTALSLKHRVSFFCNGYFIFTFLLLNAHGCACSNDIKMP